ncbi:MAG: alpha/beta hydrolase [Bacteroidetes bacterium MedPE-SWsnd-G2]|nr:MAG: alpha/beta hydrolase [Bacteroidetes bacterium MedPE-SWsnd-G2]
MSENVMHVYMMPGMAANPAIFENIVLPEDQFKVHWLEWMVPVKGELLSDYAKRMCEKIEHENIGLIGVSFGGILVQEMEKYISVKKLIVVSSVKSMHDLPRRMRIARATSLHKLLPTGLASNIDILAKFAFGDFAAKRVELYKKFLSVSDKYYLDWSIDQVVNWDQAEPNPRAIYIHGTKDEIFTHTCDDSCINIEDGTHIMIINRFKWFNENLPKLLLD